ncbi:MAG: ATP-binding cassette domain-containing protein [Nitrospirota bacterium]|jgi:oligopeptide/dipeptide ABC transporter ATP-binding protein
MSETGTGEALERRPAGAGTAVPLLEVRGLAKHFPFRRGAFARREHLRAVDGVSFTLGRDRVFSLVGESGCGKSTVARLVLRLLEPTGGEVLFKGRNISALHGEELKRFRRGAQIIFQDPFASLNPRRTVFDTVAEPMRIHALAPPEELRDRVTALLEKVGLQDVMDRYPHEFSGGQRQRICIARALAVSPELIVADEPLSALDVSIQAQIMNLLMDLRRESGISYLFISHDLHVVEYLSDEVAVMYLGKIVEQAPADELFREPRHPYTVVLLSSAPSLKPTGREKVILTGEVPSPLNVPPGCPFHPRCPRRFEPCDRVVPRLAAESGRPVACHLWNTPRLETGD